MNPKPFHVDVNMKHKHIARPLVGLLALVWIKMQINSLQLGAAFGAIIIEVSPVTLCILKIGEILILLHP